MDLSQKLLAFFANMEKYGKAKNEGIEDIEILRFIENGYKVQYVEVNSDTVAIDTVNDLERVRQLINHKLHHGESIWGK